MNVMFLDDHPLVARSLEFSTKNKVSSFTSFTEPQQLEKALENSQPDILLLDINLKNISGLDLGGELLKTYPNLKIVFLSGFNLNEYHQRAIQMGAKAFLSKDTPVEKLIESLEYINQGGTIFPKLDILESPLTDREKEILQLSADGKTQKEISDALFIASRTVGNHCTAIREKLLVSSMYEAIVRGIELGIVKIQF